MFKTKLRKYPHLKIISFLHADFLSWYKQNLNLNEDKDFEDIYFKVFWETLREISFVNVWYLRNKINTSVLEAKHDVQTFLKNK